MQPSKCRDVEFYVIGLGRRAHADSRRRARASSSRGWRGAGPALQVGDLVLDTPMPDLPPGFAVARRPRSTRADTLVAHRRREGVAVPRDRRAGGRHGTGDRAAGGAAGMRRHRPPRDQRHRRHGDRSRRCSGSSTTSAGRVRLRVLRRCSGGPGLVPHLLELRRQLSGCAAKPRPRRRARCLTGSHPRAGSRMLPRIKPGAYAPLRAPPYENHPLHRFRRTVPLRPRQNDGPSSKPRATRSPAPSARPAAPPTSSGCCRRSRRRTSCASA